MKNRRRRRGGVCRICGSVEVTVDHMIPRSFTKSIGLPTKLPLQLLCRAHHDEKSMYEKELVMAYEHKILPLETVLVLMKELVLDYKVEAIKLRKERVAVEGLNGHNPLDSEIPELFHKHEERVFEIYEKNATTHKITVNNARTTVKYMSGTADDMVQRLEAFAKKVEDVVLPTKFTQRSKIMITPEGNLKCVFENVVVVEGE